MDDVEVRLLPAPMGCLRVLLGIMTLGLIPYLFRRLERAFVLRMDDEGFQTRGGHRFAWSELTKVERTQSLMNGRVLSDQLILTAPSGKAALPLTRAENGAAAADYAIRRIPPSALRR